MRSIFIRSTGQSGAKTIFRTLPIFCLLLLLAAPAVVGAAPNGAIAGGVSYDVEPPITGTLNEPSVQPATPDRIAQLKVPAGFQVNVYASSMGAARMMAVNSDGTVYLTQREQGTIAELSDLNHDGVAEITHTVASGLQYINGITIHDNKVYAVTDKEVVVADIQAGGVLSQPKEIINNLPDAGQHPSRSLAFGLDGKLYISVGSDCNACDETNPEAATMVRAAADGSSRELFASGLRNTIGWGWQPETGEMWGFDQGIDWLGDDAQPEELNHIVYNGNYGWPFCYGKQVVNRYFSQTPPGGLTREQYCANTQPTTLDYTAHSSPIGMIFYTGDQFPASYKNGAFVAWRGSWNRSVPSGYKISFVPFANGQPQRIDDFMTGFLFNGGADVFGRPTGLAQLPDGSILLADDTNGMIYRVSYTGATQSQPAAPVSAAPAGQPASIPGMPRTGSEQDNWLYALLVLSGLILLAGAALRSVQKSHKA